MLLGFANFTTYAATLTALWDFNGSYATTNNNHDYDLIPGGGVSLVSSPLGQAAEFHGGHYDTNTVPAMDRADTIIQPSSASLNSPLSLMGWIKLNSTDGGPIFYHDRSYYLQGNDLGISFGVGGAGMGITLRDNQDQRLGANTTSLQIQPGQWVHIAMTWDGSISGGIDYYFNGQLAASTISYSGFQGLNATNPLPFRIGASFGDSAQQFVAFDGSIDQLSLWQGVLTPNEILADFNSAAVPEPSSLTLLMLGGMALFARRRGTESK